MFFVHENVCHESKLKSLKQMDSLLSVELVQRKHMTQGLVFSRLLILLYKSNYLLNTIQINILISLWANTF